jgi:hypothetical protein
MINLNMRKECLMQAIQLWLDAGGAEAVVVDVLQPNPVVVTILVEDKKKEGADAT